MQGLTHSYHCCRETHGRIDGHRRSMQGICYKNCEVATDSEGSILESLRYRRETFSLYQLVLGNLGNLQSKLSSKLTSHYTKKNHSKTAVSG